jgi:hypothetical protein
LPPATTFKVVGNNPDTRPAHRVRDPQNYLWSWDWFRKKICTLFGRNDNGSLSSEYCPMRLVLFNLNLWHTTSVSSHVSHSDYYNPLGGGDTSEAYIEKVSARMERSAKQTRRILSELHYETLLWIAARVAAEHMRTNPTFTPLTVASKYRH